MWFYLVEGDSVANSEVGVEAQAETQCAWAAACIFRRVRIASFVGPSPSAPPNLVSTSTMGGLSAHWVRMERFEAGKNHIIMLVTRLSVCPE